MEKPTCVTSHLDFSGRYTVRLIKLFIPPGCNVLVTNMVLHEQSVQSKLLIEGITVLLTDPMQSYTEGIENSVVEMSPWTKDYCELVCFGGQSTEFQGGCIISTFNFENFNNSDPIPAQCTLQVH